MDCVVIAGGCPTADDPLYAYTKGDPKALLKIAGQTMLEYVVNALQGSPHVDDVVIVGIENDSGLRFEKEVHTIPDQGSIVDNGLAGVAWIRTHRSGEGYIFISSSDIPAIDSTIVNSFFDLCQPFDAAVYYCMVTQETMEARFPNSQRTYVQLGKKKFAGGDMIIARSDIADQHRDLLLSLASGRKHAWKLARLVSLRTLVKFALHKLSIPEIELAASQVIGHPAKVIVSPDAEIAMDVDTPQHMTVIQAAMASNPPGISQS